MTYIDHYKGPCDQALTTPLEFFNRLNDEYKFTLDGAAEPHNALCPKFSTKELPVSWSGERVFCNPPWGKVKNFLDLAATADLAVLLVPARTNAKWFHRALELGAKPHFWLGRLRFGGLPSSSPVDCLLLVFEKGNK